MSIENLVFQGGGVKGSAYAGAVEVLDERGLLGSVRRVAGTSAGAITATLLAVGAGSKGLASAVTHTDFGSFLDGRFGIIGDAERLIAHCGLYPGDHFAGVLRDQIAEYSGQPELTLGGLRERALQSPGRYLDLFVIASNLTRQTAEVLCADNHPDMPLWLAVRTSMSLPLLFETVRIGDQAFVDGGLAWNYPIDLFDHPAPQAAQPGHGHPRTDTTLGFAVVPKGTLPLGKDGPATTPTDSLKAFLAALGSFMYETSNRAHFHPSDVSRTVLIDDLGVSTTNFRAPAATIEALIQSGRRSTEAYLDGRAAQAVPA